MAPPVVFVGRDGDLSCLLAALSGGVRLVLVVGDAGVGKTRFVGEGAGAGGVLAAGRDAAAAAGRGGGG
jgi:hypothetical protein